MMPPMMPVMIWVPFSDTSAPTRMASHMIATVTRLMAVAAPSARMIATQSRAWIVPGGSTGGAGGALGGGAASGGGSPRANSPLGLVLQLGPRRRAALPIGGEAVGRLELLERVHRLVAELAVDRELGAEQVQLGLAALGVDPGRAVLHGLACDVHEVSPCWRCGLGRWRAGCAFVDEHGVRDRVALEVANVPRLGLGLPADTELIGVVEQPRPALAGRDALDLAGDQDAGVARRCPAVVRLAGRGDAGHAGLEVARL